jgi:hypothetical protein
VAPCCAVVYAAVAAMIVIVAVYGCEFITLIDNYIGKISIPFLNILRLRIIFSHRTIV